MNHRLLTPLAAAVAAAALLAACGGESDANLVQSAQTYIDKGDPKAATIQLKTALQKNANNGQARYLLGTALMAQGDPVAAGVEFRKARELKYDEGKTAPALARALLEQGQPKKVIEEFSQLVLESKEGLADLKTTLAKAYAVQDDKEAAQEALKAAQQAVPLYLPALMVKARLKAADGDPDGAIFLVDEVLAKDAAHEEALFFKGELLAYAKKDWPAAFTAWRAALEKKPNLLAAHTAILRRQIETGDIAAAKTQIEALKKAHPNHVETRYLEAQIAFQDGDFKRTRELLDAVMKVRPDDPFVLQLAGVAEYRQQAMVPAENFLARALKIEPKLGLARQTLAMIYLRTSQPNKAVDLLAPMLGDKADPRIVVLAAEAYKAAGNRKRSDELYALAKKSESSNLRVRSAVALNEVAQGNDKAFAELEQLAAADKGARTDMALIAARLAKRDIDGALKAIDALEKKQPDKPLAYHLRGRIQMLKGDDAAATAGFTKALSLDAKFFPSIASLAALDLKAGRNDAAKKRLEDFVAAEPKNVRGLLALAEFKQRTGAPKDEVTTALSNAVKTAPQDTAPRVALVNHLMSTGDTKAALTAARDASAAMPNDLQVMDLLGMAQIAGGDQQQAVSTFKKLAALQPTRPQPQLRLADAYIASRDNDGARSAFKRALELQPSLLPAQRGLADLAIADRKPLDALLVAREVQKQRPTEGIGWAMEGDAESARRNWDAAIAAYRSALAKNKVTEFAIKVNRALVEGGKAADAERFQSQWIAEFPKDALFLFALGDLATVKSQYDKAEARYREVLKIAPDNGLAHNNIAWLLVKQNKSGAREHAERANALLPDRPPVLDTLALALLAEGQAAKALEVQKRAIERAPEAPTLRLTLARIYAKTGDKAQAKMELDKLAKLGDRFPQQAEVAELLKAI